MTHLSLKARIASLLCLVALLCVVGLHADGPRPEPAGQTDQELLTDLMSVVEDLPISAPEAPGADAQVSRSGTCHIDFNCGDGNVVSCNGTSSCVLANRLGFAVGVKCNGQETLCPNLCQTTKNCSIECGISLYSTCYSASGNCTANGCDGRTLRCRCPD